MIWSYILQKSKNMTIKKAQGHGQDFSKGVTLCQTEYSSKCHINPHAVFCLKKGLQNGEGVIGTQDPPYHTLEGTIHL